VIEHKQITEVELRNLIRKKQVTFGGNRKLKIYGQLNCKSGKRMKVDNRVFFATENDALEQEFRPCGNCMKEAYKMWKNGIV